MIVSKVVKKIFPISAVIFDMDGVITDTMPYHLKAWVDTFASVGIKVSYTDIYKREGQRGIDSVREIFNEHSMKFDEHIAHHLLKTKEELFKNIFKAKFINSSRSFIRQLAKKGFRLGLVTGTSRHEAQKLLPVSIWELFDVTVCGCDVQNGKPHPEPYLKALAKLNLKPNQAIVIENAPFGIRSAKTAGLTCFALETSLPKKYLTEADLVVSGFKQLTDHINLVPA